MPSSPLSPFFVPLRPPSFPSLPVLDARCWLLSGSGSGDGDSLAAPAPPLFFLGRAPPCSGSGEGDGDGDGEGEGDGDGVGDAGGDCDGVGDADPDPLAPPVPVILFLGAGLDGRGEGAGEGVGEAVGAPSSLVALSFPFFCLALSAAGPGAGEALVLPSLSSLGAPGPAWAVRAADEVAVRRVVLSSGSLTSDAVVSSSISVSRFMAGWLAGWRRARLRRFRLLLRVMDWLMGRRGVKGGDAT